MLTKKGMFGMPLNALFPTIWKTAGEKGLEYTMVLNGRQKVSHLFF
jgi:hypothetical protein